MGKMIQRDPAIIPELMKEIRFDEETGSLFWKKKLGRRPFGKPIRDGIMFRKERYRSGTVAWALQTGSWPNATVFFRDGDETNLRLSNLDCYPHTEKMDDLRKCGSYTITNSVNGRVYVGSTRYGFSSRWSVHRSVFRSGTHDNSDLQSDFDLYGLEVFKFEIAEISAKKDSREAEQRLIDRLHAEGVSLYNATLCSTSNKGLKFTKEMKRNISRAKMGSVVTPETSAKISESMKKLRARQRAEREASK